MGSRGEHHRVQIHEDGHCNTLQKKKISVLHMRRGLPRVPKRSSAAPVLLVAMVRDISWMLTAFGSSLDVPWFPMAVSMVILSSGTFAQLIGPCAMNLFASIGHLHLHLND